MIQHEKIILKKHGIAKEIYFAKQEAKRRDDEQKYAAYLGVSFHGTSVFR